MEFICLKSYSFGNSFHCGSYLFVISKQTICLSNNSFICKYYQHLPAPVYTQKKRLWWRMLPHSWTHTLKTWRSFKCVICVMCTHPLHFLYCDLQHPLLFHEQWHRTFYNHFATSVNLFHSPWPPEAVIIRLEDITQPQDWKQVNAIGTSDVAMVDGAPAAYWSWLTLLLLICDWWLWSPPGCRTQV